MKSPFSILLAAALLAGIFLASCEKKEMPAAKQAVVSSAESTAVIPPEDEVHAQYAGSKTCKECHTGAFEKWHPSNHGQAERNISNEQDNPFFTPKRTLTENGKTSETFVDADGLAKILTEGLDNQRHAYQPVRVIGNDPLRQFLIPAPGGRLQTCDISLDPAKNEWFDVYADDPREPGDWGA